MLLLVFFLFWSNLSNLGTLLRDPAALRFDWCGWDEGGEGGEGGADGSESVLVAPPREDDYHAGVKVGG